MSLRFGKRLASVDNRAQLLTNQFSDIHRKHEKVIYIQPAESPIIISKDIMQGEKRRADLPLLALPGMMASPRKFDSIGMVKIDT